MGFDWLAFLEATNASPAVAYILVQAYHSTGPQFLLLILFLSFTTWSERLSEFLALLAMTSLVTAILFALVPAVGAFDYYRPDRQLFDNFTQSAGMWHYNELIALRSGEEVEFVIGRVEGLVTFPSFHTVLAILTAYAVRDVRLLAAPVAILNAVVIVSTLPEGGHYLIDVLAGIAIAVGAIVLFRIVNAERLGEARAA
jgi:membrane-associated phospholipid phosphatase